METPKYFHLRPGEAVPPIDKIGPFKAVLVIEEDVAPEWQMQVSEWLVQSGCRYMMARGRECSSWDDSVDFANLAKVDYKEIPDDDFVMTTWHEKESLREVFRYSQRSAQHPSLTLHRTHIVHISQDPKEDDMLATYRIALEHAD